MARMLTEEEVERLEKQRELRDRARAAGSTAGMDWREKQRYREAQLNERFKQAHADAMERRRLNVLANPSAEADTTYRHSVMRDAELRAARAHQKETLGMELATRENEALQKRMGMAEQGMEAAKHNRDAAIRAAELQTASAKDIATINKDSATGVAKINAESNEKINKDRNDASVDVAGINKDASVETAGITARAQEARTYAENLIKQQGIDEKRAWDFAKQRSEMIDKIIKERKGKIHEEAAARLADERLKGMLPRRLGEFAR